MKIIWNTFLKTLGKCWKPEDNNLPLMSNLFDILVCHQNE